MNPIDGIGIVDGLTYENMSGQIMAEMMRTNLRFVSPIQHWDEFFVIWKDAVTRFFAAVQPLFERVIVAKIMLTSVRLDRTATFYGDKVEPFNERLVQMYAWLEETFKVDFISVPQERLVTGKTGGPFGGPAATHFVDETHGLWEREFIRVLNASRNQDVYDENQPLVEYAFKRAAEHEEALEEIKELNTQIEQLKEAAQNEQGEVLEDALAKLENALDVVAPVADASVRVDVIVEHVERIETERSEAVQLAKKLPEIETALDGVLSKLEGALGVVTEEVADIGGSLPEKIVAEVDVLLRVDAIVELVDKLPELEATLEQTQILNEELAKKVRVTEKQLAVSVRRLAHVERPMWQRMRYHMARKVRQLRCGSGA